MNDNKQAQAMLRMAHKDFAAIIGMEPDKDAFADEIFGFHVQQAIEKGFKAWICTHDIAYPFTHHLARLITVLINSGEEMEAFWKLDQYSAFEVQARYESGWADLE